MTNNSIKKNTENAVLEAGRIMLDYILESRHIIEKGPANFVTEVDYKVQEFLVNRLSSIIPGSNIITEESDRNNFKLDKPTWILDPVDGTTNLMYGYRHSAVSLALFMEGKPLLGFIYNPFSGEMFIAEKGKGACLNGDKIKVSSNATLADSLITFGTTPYDKSKSKKTFDIVEKTFYHSRDVRRSGSAALDIAYIACGRIDGFFEVKLQPWDFAAGMVILEEAGGRITNLQGEELKVISADGVLASNGLIHEELQTLVTSC
jgi:myo-inositol-1(or 4)-monophosphatase